MPRYVILLHEVPAGNDRPTHWDLMLERGGVLRTWALASEPAVSWVGVAEQLSDHRLAYLEYEGPVSGDRGSVSRWDEGTYQVARETDGALVVRLTGRRLSALLTLEQGDGNFIEAPPVAGRQFWRVSVAAEPSRG